MGKSATNQAHDGDRVKWAREHHFNRNGKCAVCREEGRPGEWPCIVASLVKVVDDQAKEVKRARQKPSILLFGEDRPRVPSPNGWRGRDLLAHLRWAGRVVKKLEEYAVEVMARIDADAEDERRSVALGGGRSTKADDGSNPGPTLNRVIARQRSDGSWAVDDVTVRARHLLNAVEGMGDLLPGALDDAAFLYGLSPEQVKQLVSPDGGHCENDACRKYCTGEPGDRWIINSTDGLRRCERCARYKNRTGTDRTEELCKASDVPEEVSA